jgi:3' terminal RNA ribose 2'-O-methyltransferase Hen1
MLFTVRSTQSPATDLGYLLEKHPSRTQVFDLSFGRAHLTFPEASEHACTAALYLEIDPLDLKSAARSRGDDGLLAQYVNDRAYAASSYLAVAIGSVLRSAMAGRSRERQALADSAMTLTATVSPLPVRGGPDLLERLFGPLGYTISTEPIALDEAFPSWGPSGYVRLALTGTVRLRDLLTHLSVLIPVLDANKHYYIGEDEVQKLLERGEGWLKDHPERDLITRRYLKRSGHLARLALARLTEMDGDPDPDETANVAAAREEALERPQSLNEARMVKVVETIEALGAKRVLDVGCGEGRLLGRLLRMRPALAAIGGMDVALSVLERAQERLHLDRMPEAQREKLSLFHGSLVYGDVRLKGWDALCAIEVIEHLEPFRLSAFERVIFAEAAPSSVILTTPNREYNVRYELPEGAFRHDDHRFEWTRAEFAAWAEGVAKRRNYTVTISPIGAEDPDVGAPTQLALFTR